MKICMLGSSFLPRRGGMEYVIHHLSNALVDEGHEVTVVAERTAWSGIGVEHKYELVRYGVPTRGLRRLPLAGVEAMWVLWRHHVSRHFDILHCHGVSYAGTRAVRAKRIMNIPIIMTPHGEDIQRVPEINYGLRLQPEWNRRIENNLSQADAVTAISLSVQNELGCVNPEKVVRIPNGVHISRYGKSSSRFLGDRFGLDDSTTIILSVGRNHVKKGYDFGIEAVSELLKSHPGLSVHYVIVGKETAGHQALVDRLGLNENVSLVEELSPDEVAECYHSADIFFSPSIIEGLSLVSVEALACGLPLVVTDVPGNEDVVRDTGAGIIVSSRQPASMAEGLFKLINDASLRQEYARIALLKSEAFDWANIARQYAALYADVLKGDLRGTRIS